MAQATLSGGGTLGEVPYLRPHPGPRLFARRAARLAALAPGHAAGDYLAFLALVARAQHGAATALALAPPWPRRAGCDEADRPLDAFGPRDPSWREALRLLLADLGREAGADAVPAQVRATLARLRALAPGALERLADLVLGAQPGPQDAGDVAAAPLLGAALQVAFGAAAGHLPPASVRRVVEEGCPACGFPPVVGEVLGDDKLRYLWCGLCATAWHHTRVQCTRCRSAARLSYLVVEGAGGAAKAEQCDGCGAYLKLLYVEQAPALDPWADDLATLPLDLLMAGRGSSRLGVNLLLAPGPGIAGA
jgi:FdhE protein